MFWQIGFVHRPCDTENQFISGRLHRGQHTLGDLVRGEGHGGGDKSEKGDDLEGLHGAIYYLNILRIKNVGRVRMSRNTSSSALPYLSFFDACIRRKRISCRTLLSQYLTVRSYCRPSVDSLRSSQFNFKVCDLFLKTLTLIDTLVKFFVRI